jgi:hypothetical protein
MCVLSFDENLYLSQRLYNLTCRTEKEKNSFSTTLNTRLVLPCEYANEINQNTFSLRIQPLDEDVVGVDTRAQPTATLFAAYLFTFILLPQFVILVCMCVSHNNVMFS